MSVVPCEAARGWRFPDALDWRVFGTKPWAYHAVQIHQSSRGGVPLWGSSRSIRHRTVYVRARRGVGVPPESVHREEQRIGVRHSVEAQAERSPWKASQELASESDSVSRWFIVILSTTFVTLLLFTLYFILSSLIYYAMTIQKWCTWSIWS